jgi:hypothetical protein
MLSEGRGEGRARAKTNVPYFKPPCPCFTMVDDLDITLKLGPSD